MIVAKFGGTSCASADSIRRIGTILKDNPERKYLVVSAPGKTEAEQEKVTDLLIRFYDEKDEKALRTVQRRFQSIIDGLHVSFDLTSEIDQIRAAAEESCSRDYIISRGEYLNARIISAWLGWHFLDSADVLFFDDEKRFLSGISCRFIREKLHSQPYTVVPGFYGSGEDGHITDFPRGGSDITGSVLAKALHAELYENWTDVSGILSADPRIVSDPKVIPVITYRELRELSYMGASVLQENAVFPVRESGIPIAIRNTFHPEEGGTLITAERKENRSVLTGLAGKTGFSNIQIEKAMMNEETGFGAEVLSILARHHVGYEHTPTSIDTISVLVETEELKDCRQDILKEIQDSLHPDRLFIEDDIALIAVVGEGINGRKGTAARLFTALSDAGINIRMIDVGFSELSIILGVSEADYKKTIQTIAHDLNDLF